MRPTVLSKTFSPSRDKVKLESRPSSPRCEDRIYIKSENKAVVGSQARVEVDRKVPRKFPVSILIFQCCIVFILISTGLVSGILRFRTLPRKRLPLAVAHWSSPSEIASPPPPPWLVRSTGENPAPEKIFIMQGIYDTHFFNGLPPPRDFAQSVAFEVRSEANSARVPRRFDRTHLRFEILHCVSCAPVDGSKWVSAISSSGLSLAALAKMNADESASMRFSDLQVTTTDRWSHIDIGVPVGCQDGNRLRYFVQLLSNSIKGIRSRVCVRLLMTRFPCDDRLSKSLTIDEVENLSGLKKRKLSKDTTAELDRAVFLKLKHPVFTKEQAIDAIHSNTNHTNNRSLLIVIDADTYVDIQFVYSAMALVSRGVSAYFPILWMAYNPRSIKSAFTFRESRETGLFDKDQGVWRTAGFGIYAMASEDAANISIKGSPNFNGWGGEGFDSLIGSVSKSLHIIRKLERGLIHMWHPKYCQSRTTIRRDCLRSVAFVESSPLPMLVKFQQERFPKGIISAPISSRIMIAVSTSRVTFAQRVAALDSTWANKRNLPLHVFVKYFVGGQGNHFPGLAVADTGGQGFVRKQLALQAGLARPVFDPDESIVILSDVEDNEYPPMNKNSALLKSIAGIAAASLANINWIMVVDDDTLVNIGGLLRLIANLDDQIPVLLGHTKLDHGSEELDVDGSTYCLGSASYVMPYVMLEKIVKDQDSCIHDSVALRPKSLSASFWRSIVIRMCMEKISLPSAGCKQDDPTYQASKLFRQILNRNKTIANRDISRIVSVHPLDNLEDMQVLFKRLTGERDALTWLD